MSTFPWGEETPDVYMAAVSLEVFYALCDTTPAGGALAFTSDAIRGDDWRLVTLMVPPGTDPDQVFPGITGWRSGKAAIKAPVQAPHRRQAMTEPVRAGDFVHYVYRKWTIYYAQVLRVGIKRATIRLDNAKLSPRKVPLTSLRPWPNPLMGEQDARALADEVMRESGWQAAAVGPDSFTKAWHVEAIRDGNRRFTFEWRGPWLKARTLPRTQKP